jgi:hypothetical protein
MILHGVEAPNIIHATLRRTYLTYKRKTAMIWPTNLEEKNAEVRNKTFIKKQTGETAFMQHSFKILRAGGKSRCRMATLF